MGLHNLFHLLYSRKAILLNSFRGAYRSCLTGYNDSLDPVVGRTEVARVLY